MAEPPSDPRRAAPPDVAELLRRGARRHARGDVEGALKALRNGMKHHPDEWRFPANAATLLQERGERSTALRLINVALKLAPDEPFLHYKLGAWLQDLGRSHAAVTVLRRVLELTGGDLTSHLQLAIAHLESKDVESAAILLERALSMAPDSADVHTLQGLMLAAQGKRDESDAELEHALRLDPRCSQAAYHLARRGKPVDTTELEEHVRDSRAPRASRARASFALGHALDRAGEHARAFACFDRANALAARRWDADAHSAMVDLVLASCTRELFEGRRAPELGGTAPIFIVGLPRTGSTLLEQMLGEHPDLFAVGEHSAGIPRIARELSRVGVRPFPAGLHDLQPAHRVALAERYRESIRAAFGDVPAGARTVDKLLANHQALGLIALLFPDAKVLNCRRDPRDSGLSAYQLEFQRNELPWTYRLDHIARYYRDYERVDRHWKQHLPLDVLDVRYEELVADPVEGQRRILEFLDLEWTADCMRYAWSKRPVFTASAIQVREKPHTRAIERWRPHAAHLGPLLEVAREWGYPE